MCGIWFTGVEGFFIQCLGVEFWLWCALDLFLRSEHPPMYKNRNELVAEICERIGRGEPLAQICRDEHMPSVRVVSDWTREDEGISASIARARLDGFDAIAADCLEIADDKTQDYKPSDKGPAFDAEHVQRSKLRVETRLKLLAKWDPKRYGERQHVEHSGGVDIASTILESRKRSGID